MLTRRELLRYTLAAAAAPVTKNLFAMNIRSGPEPVRCINVVNFIRGVEPRFKTDLLLPVRKQMECVLEHKLPATWLLQFDALVSGPFVPFLKEHLARNHEVGTWFEMNEMHCKAAGVEWRGRPGYEWDYNPCVAFSIGYTKDERIKLADTAMKTFKSVWGRYPKSVASWNLDSITMAHLAEKYGIDAFAVCRDQIATDGFTIWGAPIAGYYPSKVNCWSPALAPENQINTPVFRMLGQDPVYYYYRDVPIPGGRKLNPPDTMEPVWISGQDPTFVKTFLDMISKGPTGHFAYAQLGQENSFPWPGMEKAYPMQMAALAALSETGSVHVETMGESGRRFKKAFRSTPTQAQVQLVDPFGNEPGEKSIWYQSRYYRANLHIRGALFFLRDLTVYSDSNPQPFLDQATKEESVEQRMPAVLDGYLWSNHPGSFGEAGAGGFFEVEGERLRLTGEVKVSEVDTRMSVELPADNGQLLAVHFDETSLSLELGASAALTLSLEWDPSRMAVRRVEPDRVHYEWLGFEYTVDVRGGKAEQTVLGWRATGQNLTLYFKRRLIRQGI